MDKIFNAALTKAQKYVLFAISLGNVLESYDMYLYVFWAPTLSALFFDASSESVRLFGTIAFFALGFIFRPFGGIFFGRMGDRIGRKKTFIISMLVMTFFTFLIGFIPVYSEIGIFAPVLLAICKILQTLPSGGELPGAFCYLYENADHDNKKFMSSFAGFGVQIGIAIAALECYLLKNHFLGESFSHWGWRISFIVGGVIGLVGLCLRYHLHETRQFREMAIHHRMTQAPIWSVFKRYWQRILRGISFGAAQTVSFHFISVLLPVYFFHFGGINDFQTLITSLVLFAVTTIPLPIFGLLAEKYDVKYLAIGSCIIMISLLYPLYYVMCFFTLGNALLVVALFALFLTCLTALWPYILTHLFPTRVRYTCVGLSFNIGDGVLGGLSSIFTLYFFSAEKPITFIWIALIGCVISIISCLKMKSLKAGNF